MNLIHNLTQWWSTRQTNRAEQKKQREERREMYTLLEATKNYPVLPLQVHLADLQQRKEEYGLQCQSPDLGALSPRQDWRIVQYPVGEALEWETVRKKHRLQRIKRVDLHRERYHPDGRYPLDGRPSSETLCLWEDGFYEWEIKIVIDERYGGGLFSYKSWDGAWIQSIDLIQPFAVNRFNRPTERVWISSIPLAALDAVGQIRALILEAELRPKQQAA